MAAPLDEFETADIKIEMVEILNKAIDATIKAWENKNSSQVTKSQQ